MDRHKRLRSRLLKLLPRRHVRSGFFDAWPLPLLIGAVALHGIWLAVVAMVLWAKLWDEPRLALVLSLLIIALALLNWRGVRSHRR